MTNEQRAAAALAALQAYRDANEGTPLDCPEGMDEGLGDLLCDLCHLIAAQGIDPAKLIARSIRGYMDERDFPSDGFAPAGDIAFCTITTWRNQS